MNDITHHDIIGDIHGRYDKLANLMERMGYQPAAVGFIPPAGHRALFLGDLIDTKPGHPFPGGVRATLRAVKAMCDRGHALCLMGRVRSNMRACWWELPASGIRYDQLVFPPHTEIPDDPVSEESFGRIPGYASDAPPVFFGHYLKPAQSPLYPERHNVACLDHSAATGGPLIAYRWNGGPNINPEHYICHS